MPARFVAAILIVLPLIVVAYADPPPLQSLVAELREEIRVLRIENDALRHRLGLPPSPGWQPPAPPSARQGPSQSDAIRQHQDSTS